MMRSRHRGRGAGAATIVAIFAASAVVVAAGLGPAPAGAIPWDMGGAIPPSATPAPTRPDPLCLQSYADAPPRGGPRLRFGIGPDLAGEAGTAQTTPVVPQNRAKRDAALLRLKGHRGLTVRLNRLFESDGRTGIRRFARMARHYRRLAIDVELQVRYHPTAAENGDMKRWLSFVRTVVRTFGPMPNVTGLQIANEVNLAISPNTSDGAFTDAKLALVKGVIAAKRLSEKLGYGQLKIGFNYAWRFDPVSDAAFWSTIGRLGGRSFRRDTDWVGIDTYPGTFVPPQPVIVNIGDAFLESVAQVRDCYMPLAGFGRRTPLRIEETGWPTGPGRSEQMQDAALKAIVLTANAYRGTYGITDFRWFDLRDNNSHGPNFQSYFGLLRDDYSPKPAFATYRRLIARYGASRRRRPRLGRLVPAARPDADPCLARHESGLRGDDRNRTGVDGFAGRCVATPPRRRG